MWGSGAVPLSPFGLIIHIIACYMVLKDFHRWESHRSYKAISSETSFWASFVRAQAFLFIYLLQAACVFDLVVVRLAYGHARAAREVGGTLLIYTGISFLLGLVFWARVLLLPKKDTERLKIAKLFLFGEFVNLILLTILMVIASVW